MLNKEKETHESYGLIGFYRTTFGGGGIDLFGSSIRHGHGITMRIHTASRQRDLHCNWIHAEDFVCEVLLSQNQFAELLTSMNVGDGVPCTIRGIGKKRMDDCPSVEQREIFEEEFKQDVHKVGSIFVHRRRRRR